MNTQHFRHGDLTFIPVEKTEGDVINHDGSFVLAIGEHTTHRHVITAPIGDLVITKDSKGNLYLSVKTGATITHEEHRPITLTPGVYRMGHEREMDYFLGEVARVQD